jgi:hypothetical protein
MDGRKLLSGTSTKQQQPPKAFLGSPRHCRVVFLRDELFWDRVESASLARFIYVSGITKARFGALQICSQHERKLASKPCCMLDHPESYQEASSHNIQRIELLN